MAVMIAVCTRLLFSHKLSLRHLVLQLILQAGRLRLDKEINIRSCSWSLPKDLVLKDLVTSYWCELLMSSFPENVADPPCTPTRKLRNQRPSFPLLPPPPILDYVSFFDSNLILSAFFSALALITL